MTGDRTPLWAYAIGVLGFTVTFLTVPLLLSWINRKVDQSINLHVHAALHPNVTVLHDQSGRSA